MSDQLAENSNTRKRIKQLENQNIKFRSLLKNAVDLSEQESSGITKLQDEADSLKKTIECLEKEKAQLEEELTTVLEENKDSDMMRTVCRLEEEHVELKAKLEEVLAEIGRENSEIEDLKAEDEQLKQIMAALESEKLRLLQEIKIIESTTGSQSSQSLRLHQKLSQIESKKAALARNLKLEQKIQTPLDILSNFKSLEKTYKDYVEALQEQSSLKERVSELESKNEELIKVVQKTESEDIKSQVKLNGLIINSNSNLVDKISKVKSKLQSNLDYSNDLVKTLETSEELDAKISKLENEKNTLYNELEKTLENSSYEINKLSENISDPEIKRLVNEIEIQKCVLLHNLKCLKLKEGSQYSSNYDAQLPSIPEFKLEMNQDVEIPSLPTTIEAQILTDSNRAEQYMSGNNELPHQSTSSKADHKKLENIVVKLEQQKELLLMQLQSVSSTSSQPPKGNITQNEQQLQTQSELHSTFMQEESSQEVAIAPNYDDATNQLYADEDARLEQRIRELETENARIKSELDGILEEIRNDKSEMSRLQNTGQMLKQRIDELENNSPVLEKDLN